MRISKLRRALAVFLSAMLIMMTVLSIMPVKVNALAAAKKEISITEMYPNGCLKTITVLFQADKKYGEAYGKIGIQTQATSMHYQNPYIPASGAQNSSDWPATVNAEGFIAFGDGDEFKWSEGNECLVNVNFDDGVIDLNNSQDYYIYLWTRAPSYGIYPDLQLRHLTTEGGKLLDENRNPIEQEKTHSHEWSTEWTNNQTHHWHECTAADCDITEDSEKDSYDTHNYNQEIADSTTIKAPATCASPAVYYKSCVCGKLGTETFEYGDSLSHTVTLVPENAATCTEDGNKAHYKCSVCGKLFSDKTASIATTLDKVTISATGHTPAEAVKENVVDPTCTVDGSYDEVFYCSVCDYEISRTPKTTDATGHSFTNYISNGDADCLNDGTKTAECDNGCGETDTVDDVDSKTGHKWSTKYTYDKNYHWHECEHTYCPVTNDSDKDGYAAHISSGEATEDNDEHCTVCGYVINPTLDHLCGRTELTFVPEVPETCTEDGVKAHYVCRCGKLYSDKAAAAEVTAEDLRIPAHHVWSETWSHDETQHYHLCTVCDEKNDTTLHTYGDWTITKLATPTADGEKERSCSVCGYVQTGVVNYIPDNTDNDTGDINNTTDADSNACHGDTELTKSEIIEKIDLTPEELTAVENGEDINIFLTVEDNSANVSESDKTLTESVLNNDDTIATYLDIKLFKQVGENSPTQITNTNGDVTIVFEMPESIICTDKNVTREYFIIRVHEGTAETLKCTFDPATGKASFMTDKFSSYAIVYKDTVDTVTNDAEEAAEDIEMILDDFTPDNDTTAEDILSEIEDVNDDNVTIEISSFEIVPATEDSEGSITVTIVITDSEGNAETVEKEIVIPKLPKHEKPAVTIYYPVITSGNVSADRSSAAAGETVNVNAGFGYDIIVTTANGQRIAKITEKGSFTMPACKVYVTAVQNETFALMATAWRNSYVYSYDSDMNKIKVSSTKKQGVIVVNLGEDYAGKSFTIYSGRK
ncbi:MAG: hypothetical protein SOZ56_11720, partial [Oscillospiraceae bacterium]|nr:hypothetical protein [Oscillospiraceae bacterium]